MERCYQWNTNTKRWWRWWWRTRVGGDGGSGGGSGGGAFSSGNEGEALSLTPSQGNDGDYGTNYFESGVRW